MKPFLGILVCLIGTSGCALFDSHAKDFDLMRGLAADAASRIQDGSMAQMQVSGQALNPGIKVEAYIKYGATVTYEGLAGQFAVGSQGPMGTREAPKYIQDIMNSTSMSEQQKWDLIKDWAKPKVPIGTCCLVGEKCILVTKEVCDTVGGLSWNPNVISCTPNPCVAPPVPVK
jgi:hypothetical protein